MNPLIQFKPVTLRGIAALLGRVAASAMILLATPLSARADDLLIDRYHTPLINTGSAKCFEPTGAPSDWAGLPIQQRTCSHGVQNDGSGIDRPIQWYQFQDQ